MNYFKSSHFCLLKVISFSVAAVFLLASILFACPKHTSEELLTDTENALAPESGFEKKVIEEKKAVELTETQERALIAINIEKGRELDNLAKSENFQGKSKAEIFKDEKLGAAYVRYRVLEFWKERNRPLYDKTVAVLKMVQAGEINISDYSPELLDVMDGFYGITSKEFIAGDDLGLRTATDRIIVPLFEGSYCKTLQMSFPELMLNPLGFTQYQGDEGWQHSGNSIAYTQYRIALKRPELWKKYLEVKKKIEKGELNPEEYTPELRDVLDGFYKIRGEQFMQSADLGLGSATEKRKAPQFDGTYMIALQKSFPEVKLNLLGFGRYAGEGGWNNIEASTAYIRYRIASKRPELWQKYLEVKKKLVRGEIIADEYPRELQEVLEGFYGILQKEFVNTEDLALGSAINKKQAPQYNESYIIALQKSFPELQLNPLGFRSPIDGGWRNTANAIAYIRYRIAMKRPELWQKYLDVKKKIKEEKIAIEEYPPELLELTDHFYRFSSDECRDDGNGLGLSPITSKEMTPQLGGKYITAFQASFPEIKLNPLACRKYKGEEEEGWRSKDVSTDFVRYRIAKRRPDLWRKYVEVQRKIKQGVIIPEEYPPEYTELLELMYNIGIYAFKNKEGLGLSNGLMKEYAPHFGGSYISVLQQSFPELKLNPLGFSSYQGEGGWSDLRKSTAYVRYRIALKRPELWRKYLEVKKRIERGDIALEEYPQEYRELVCEFYKIGRPEVRDIDDLGLDSAVDKRRAPQYNGSYVVMLQMSFPELRLNPLGFSIYFGSDPNASIEFIRYRIAEKRPELWRKYLNVRKKIEKGEIRPEEYPQEVREVLEGFYSIRARGFVDVDDLGLDAAIGQRGSRLGRSHITALQMSFPELGLNPIGFLTKGGWSNKKDSNAYIRYMIAKKRPELWQKYLAVKRMIKNGEINPQENPQAVREVLEEFYEIGNKDTLRDLGLISATKKKSAPQYGGSCKIALQMSFPELPWDLKGVAVAAKTDEAVEGEVKPEERVPGTGPETPAPVLDREEDAIRSDTELTDAQKLRLLIGRLIWTQRRFGIEAFLSLLEKSGFDEKYAQEILAGELLSWFGNKAAINSIAALLKKEGKAFPARILDAGSGPSTFTRALHDLGMTGTVTDLDASAGMLRYGLPENEKAAGTIERLPFKDGTFDMVHFGFSLHYPNEDDRARALVEAGRVVKTGGLVSVLSPLVITDEFLKCVEEMGYRVCARPAAGAWVELLLLEKVKDVRMPQTHKLVLGEKVENGEKMRGAFKKPAGGGEEEREPVEDLSVTRPDILEFGEKPAIETLGTIADRMEEASASPVMTLYERINVLETSLGRSVSMLSDIENYDIFEEAAQKLFDRILASDVSTYEIKLLREMIVKQGMDMQVAALRKVDLRKVLDWASTGKMQKSIEELRQKMRTMGFDLIVSVRAREVKVVSRLKIVLEERLEQWERNPGQYMRPDMDAAVIGISECGEDQ